MQAGLDGITIIIYLKRTVHLHSPEYLPDRHHNITLAQQSIPLSQSCLPHNYFKKAGGSTAQTPGNQTLTGGSLILPDGNSTLTGGKRIRADRNQILTYGNETLTGGR